MVEAEAYPFSIGTLIVPLTRGKAVCVRWLQIPLAPPRFPGYSIWCRNLLPHILSSTGLILSIFFRPDTGLQER